MQDVHLGLLVALLPALAGQKNVALAKKNSGAVHVILSGHDNANDSGGLLQVQLQKSFKWASWKKVNQLECYLRTKDNDLFLQ